MTNKKIRVLVPCFNEEQNVEPLAEAIIKHFETELPNYDYLINFIDNKSTDGTRAKIRALCEKNKRIVAIFNSKNFGQFNSPYYGILQNDIAGGSDCTIVMCADFQDPIDMISKFVKKWEEGYEVVAGIKTKSKENKIMRFLRTCYYKFIKKLSSVEQLEHFTGFALYDNKFINVMRDLKDPSPFLRGIVAELCGSLATIEYTQEKRRAGKTHNNFKTLYDGAMLSITTYTKRIPRLATIFGAIFTGLSFVGLLTLGILKIFLPIDAIYLLFVGLALVGFADMFFVGMLGEYIVNLNVRSLNRPLVVEELRINDNSKQGKTND